MAKTLEAILHVDNLTGIINDPIGGVPDRLPPAFTRRGRRFPGNTCGWFKGATTRQTAKLVQYGASPAQASKIGLSWVPATMMHFLEEMTHDPNTLINLMQYDNPARQQMGVDEVIRQTNNFNLKFTNSLLCAIYSIFRYGAVYFDGSGNILPSSSGAVITIDYGVPAGNQNQLNVFGTGAIIGASWGTAGTDIIGDIIAIKKAALKLTGYPIMHAFYGENIPNYFGVNTSVGNWVHGNPRAQDRFLQGMIPDLCEIQWHPIYEAFFADSTNTNQDWFGGDTVVFTPDPSPDWWEVMEGSVPVANQPWVQGADARSVLPSEMFGKFSLGYQTGPVPATVKQVAGDTVLPTLKVGGAIFIADVTP